MDDEGYRGHYSFFLNIYSPFLNVLFFFQMSLSVLCIVRVVATELWTKIGWFTQIKRLLPLTFFVSIVWNWMYLYRVSLTAT